LPTLYIESRSTAKTVSYWDRNVPASAVLIYKQFILTDDTDILCLLMNTGDIAMLV
jgi:hypothetical protein